MGLLQKKGVLTYPDTPKTILTHSSAYKLTAELPNMEYAPQHIFTFEPPPLDSPPRAAFHIVGSHKPNPLMDFGRQTQSQASLTHLQ